MQAIVRMLWVTNEDLVESIPFSSENAPYLYIFLRTLEALCSGQRQRTPVRVSISSRAAAPSTSQ